MFDRIVVGTDGSETANEAVRQATELAKSVGASIDLVSAYEPVSSARLREEAQQVPKDLEWMVNPREDVDATLETAAEKIKEAGVDVQIFAREGDPADAILDVAEEGGAGLIVVGNKGMTGAKRFLLGSGPNKVSHPPPPPPPPRHAFCARHPAARRARDRRRPGRAPPHFASSAALGALALPASTS